MKFRCLWENNDPHLEMAHEVFTAHGMSGERSDSGARYWKGMVQDHEAVESDLNSLGWEKTSMSGDTQDSYHFTHKESPHKILYGREMTKDNMTVGIATKSSHAR